MKFSTSLLTVTVITVFSVVLATSCKKSNSSAPSGGLGASLSGSAWASTIPSQGVFSSGVFEIAGGQIKGGDTTVLTLEFLTPIPLNKAVSSDSLDIDVAYLDAKTQKAYDAESGSGHTILTINSWDSVNHKISGSFSGVMYNDDGSADSLVVTNGSFNLGYTIQ